MRPSSRTLRRAVVTVAATLGLVAAPTGLAAASTAPTVSPGADYVNMGDSYSAGSGILPPAPGADLRCSQSALNWAHDLARSHGYDLTDVSCGGATTSDYTSSQFVGVAPQLDALSPDTDLVTMTIGGNDEGLFADLIADCSTAAALTLGQGSPCKDAYGDTFVSTIRNSTYPKLVTALNEVQAAAPNATVAISGYLRILPSSGGCYPIMPVASGDVPYLDHIEKTLNHAIKKAAANTGATYVDESHVSKGHDACQPIGTRWVEPAIGSTNYVPIHPNALGERAMARQTAATPGLS
jgi:lysophospholipase L1-like esterase